MQYDVNKIITSNYKYYFSDSYAKFIRKNTMILSLITAIAIGFSIFMIKCIIMKYGIIHNASFIDLGEQEVMDWAVIEARRSTLDSNTGIIFIFTAMFTSFIIYIYSHIKSYKLYKMKTLLVLLPTIFWFLSLLILYINIYRTIQHISPAYISGIIYITIKVLSILFSLRKFMPLEIKSQYESLFKIFDLFTNYIQKKL